MLYLEIQKHFGFQWLPVMSTSMRLNQISEEGQTCFYLGKSGALSLPLDLPGFCSISCAFPYILHFFSLINFFSSALCICSNLFYLYRVLLNSLIFFSLLPPLPAKLLQSVSIFFLYYMVLPLPSTYCSLPFIPLKTSLLLNLRYMFWPYLCLIEAFDPTGRSYALKFSVPLAFVIQHFLFFCFSIVSSSPLSIMQIVLFPRGVCPLSSSLLNIYLLFLPTL